MPLRTRKPRRMRKERPLHPTLPTTAGKDRTVLIVSARMGGGHDGAASGLSRLLSAAGYEPQVVDLLETMRFGYGRFINSFYHAQLRFAPWSYQAIYSSWRTRPALVRSANAANTRAARKHLLDRIAASQPMVIVSTYNIGSQVLGELSASGELQMPVYSFVTDFGVHPYWIHDAIDGYLAVHDSSASHIASLSDAPVAVCGPLVAPSFASAADTAASTRGATRASLDLSSRDTVALVVAGAWGVGDVEATVADLMSIEACVPVVVCGNNARLATRLLKSMNNPKHVLGYIETMPAMMSAADVLVENAGGMTSFEAFASGLPVITHRPIPGHGLDNAHAMAAAGVTRLAHNRGELAAALESLGPGGAARSQQIEVAHRVFPADPTTAVLDLIDSEGRSDRAVSEDPNQPSPR